MELQVLGNRYEIIEKIGSGGMADVFEGLDRRLGRKVAIKCLKTNNVNLETFSSHFLKEASSAALLNHRSIVSVYDYDEEVIISENGNKVIIPYIVMEYLEGKTLKDLIICEQIHIKKACEIIIDVLDALSYSHSKGVIHRDIKPANIMVSSEGKAKIMDFGIARLTTETADSSSNEIAGTAQYISPEQAKNEAIDYRSDIYSTGCVLFELITGRIPFTGDTIASITYQQVNSIPPTPSKINRFIPTILDQIVLKALSKNPNKRYQTSKNFADNLQNLIDSRALDAISMGIQGHRRVENKKNNKKLIYIVSIAIALVCAICVLLLFFQPDKPQESSSVLSPTQTQTSKKTAKNVTLPALTGLSIEKAKSIIEGLGLKVGAINYEHNPKILKDCVIKTDKDDLDKILEKSTVNIILSDGKVQLPDLVGKTEEEARSIAEKLLLVVNVNKVESDKQEGTVISQKPLSSEVEQGSTITIEIATIKQVLVPNVISKTKDEAIALLEGLGLKVETTEQKNDTIPKDTVISQSIQSGTTVDINTTITIDLSSGPEQE